MKSASACRRPVVVETLSYFAFGGTHFYRHMVASIKPVKSTASYKFSVIPERYGENVRS